MPLTICLNPAAACVLIGKPMNQALKSYIEKYTQLENGILELLAVKCSSLCAQCTRICCDIVHCREAITSPFLMLAHGQTEQFNEKNGFLSSTGCTLKEGRPPMCYGYFCDDHFYHQPDQQHEEVLKILGALPYHATLNALHDLPLEDLNQEQLDQLDFQQLNHQISESLEALNVIRTFYREGTLPETAHATLHKIRLSE